MLSNFSGHIFGDFVFFFRFVTLAISLEENENEETGFLFVGSSMIDISSKDNV